MLLVVSSRGAEYFVPPSNFSNSTSKSNKFSGLSFTSTINFASPEVLGVTESSIKISSSVSSSRLDFSSA
jgi:hypothetical protein